MAASCDKQINLIFQGSTPTFVFDTCIDTNTLDLSNTHIRFSSGSTMVDKFGDDISIEDSKLSVTLSQNDTMMFNGSVIIIQILATLTNGAKVPSVKKIIPTEAVVGGGVW